MSSDELMVYKISAQQFYDNFGKDNGALIQRMRAKAIMDNNWINTVVKRLQAKEIGQIMSECEFVDNSISPDATRKVIPESPYLKNRQVGGFKDIAKQEERKRMKEQLLAPFSSKPIKSSLPNQSSGASDAMENKYSALMGFGTPDIRPSKKLKDKNMTQEQIRSKINLQRL